MVDSDTLLDLRELRKGKVSPNSINKEVATLVHMRKLLSDGSIIREVNGKKIPWMKPKPFSSKINILEEIVPPEVMWEPDEIEKLLAHTNDTFVRTYILMGCLAALRKRTCQEFRREWVNWDLMRLEIPPAGRKRGKKKIHFVNLVDALDLELKKVWGNYRPFDSNSSKYFRPHLSTYYSDAHKSEPYQKGYLFCDPNDPEKMWKGFETLWRELKKRVDINKRFHDLKHTAGTLFQWATSDIKATIDFLDESTTIMAGCYIRASDEIRKGNMQKFNALFQQKKEDKTLLLPDPPVMTIKTDEKVS
jgi:integrase